MKLRTAIWIFIVLGAVAAGLYLSKEPWAYYQQQKEEARLSTERMQEAERKRAELIQQIAEYESSSGKEALARTRGYLRPGERPVED
ncbi:MAG: hypothetical protein ACK4P3_08570 [Fimbriimonadaceae bacterium]|jgi:hypothetical protein